MMNQYARYPNAPPRSLVRMPSQPEYPVSNRRILNLVHRGLSRADQECLHRWMEVEMVLNLLIACLCDCECL